MEIAFNHGIEISAAKEKKIQEYIYRIYSTLGINSSLGNNYILNVS